MAEKIPSPEAPVRPTKKTTLRKNQKSENTLKGKVLRPVARREEPPRAIRALGYILGAPLVGLAVAGQQVKKVIEKPINAYNARRYRPPLTIQQRRERQKNQPPIPAIPPRRPNMPQPKQAPRPKPTVGQRIRTGITHIINTPMYVLGGLALGLEYVSDKVQHLRFRRR